MLTGATGLFNQALLTAGTLGTAYLQFENNQEDRQFQLAQQNQIARANADRDANLLKVGLLIGGVVIVARTLAK